MWRLSRKASIVVAILALGSAAAGGVVAATTQSSDERALQPTRQAADPAIERRVNRLLARMTLEEKLEQIQLLPDFS
jgi:beta-glucosidase